MPPHFASPEYTPVPRWLCPRGGREHFDRCWGARLASVPQSGYVLPQCDVTREERDMAATEGVEITGPHGDRYDEILTPEALDLIAALQREFGRRRGELLAARAARQEELSAGAMLDFLPGTRQVREDTSWRVAPPAPGLVDRRVEITGPTERKMTINALNSGANVWLADFEDANTPFWENMIIGQLNLKDALDRTIDFTSEESKSYRLAAAPVAGTWMRSTCWWTASGCPAACSTSPCISHTARGASLRPDPGRTSTCPRSRATLRRGSGTTRSTWRRTRWESRAGRSGQRCSLRPSPRRSRWKRSSTNFATTAPG